MAVTQGTWLGLPDFGITEFFTGGTQPGLTEPTSSTQIPQDVYQQAQAGPGAIPTPTGVQQGTGTGYVAPVLGSSTSQNASLLNYTPAAGGVPTPTYQPQQQAPLTDRQRFEEFVRGGGYGGWNMDSAWQDWLATGGSKAGETGGGDPYAALRGEIGGAWDQYINSLGGQEQGLLTSKTAQEQIAESQARQGLGTLATQKAEGLGQLGAERGRIQTGQAKTLRDLSGNLRNAFMAGNVYLGARGAGDSSAANQYALALTKEGSRQRGDVMAQTSEQMSEIGRREQDLTNRFQQEERNIEETKSQQIASIASWFAQAQNQIRQAQAQGQLNKAQDLQNVSRDILNRALAAMDQVNQEASSRRTALESWATSNAQNINQLKSNFANIAQFSANIPQAQRIAGTPQVDSMGNIRVQTGYGSSSDERRRLQGLV